MEDIPLISGPGEFNIEVVGESHYSESFAKICGDSRDCQISMTVRAHLVLEDDNEHDDQAVLITIQGHKVGYLPRPTAREFRKAVVDGDLQDYSRFECDAHIRGKWEGKKSKEAFFGVWLDRPEDGDPDEPHQFSSDSKLPQLSIRVRHASAYAISKCELGDELTIWSRDDLDNVYFYAPGTSGGSGLLTKVLKSQVPALHKLMANTTAYIHSLDGLDCTILCEFDVSNPDFLAANQ